MEPSISLDVLLGRLRVSGHRDTAKRIAGNDASVRPQAEELLDIIAKMDPDLVYDQFEGPQSMNHLGFSAVHLGNYFGNLGDKERASRAYFIAWEAFIHPDNRGHEYSAHKLVEEHPELMGFPQVMKFYSSERKTA